MSHELASIIMVSDEFVQDTAHWELIFGYPPEATPGRAIFYAGNVNIQLVARAQLTHFFPDIDTSPPASSLWGLSFRQDSIVETPMTRYTATRGLPVFVGDAPYVERRHDQDCVSQIDHVVVETKDANGVVDLFGRRLGIRLALRKNVPAWGGEMLFFRTNHMSIEVIANAKNPEIDSLWGIALRCDDINSVHGRLSHAGVSVSEIRDGRKKGTRVATIKDHVMGIGTLLIEHST